MEKPIVFRNKNNKQLVGILHMPKGRKKFPLVVICHGFGGTKTGRKFVKLSRSLVKNNIASFRFDFEGCGDSDGNFETITVKRQISDLKSAIDWVLRQKSISKQRIALLGSSLGSVVAALFITQNEFPAKSLVFWAPAFNQEKLIPAWHNKSSLKKWKKQKYFVRKEDKIGISYLKENEKKDYSQLLFGIKVPILIIHGKKDETVPFKFSKKLAKNYKNIKLIPIVGGNHKFEDYYVQDRLIKETVSWLKDKLWTRWG